MATLLFLKRQKGIFLKNSITYYRQHENNFYKNWISKALLKFNLTRPILRYELAEILDCYNIFESFEVDFYGNTIVK